MNTSINDVKNSTDFHVILLASELRKRGARHQEDSMSSKATTDLDDVYVLPPVDSADAIPDMWQSPATYTTEVAVRCPHCEEAIRTVRVVGLTRSQVAFTSTLPRKGRVFVCPECDAILPVELSGLL
jgi:hypothetical protein